VLSLGKVRLSGESYYLNAVADGIDEYYRGVGEAPGRWAGTAAEPLGLGLGGEDAADELHALWAGPDPATVEKLGRFAGREVAGWDLTCRAPKSVSLLAGLGDPDTAAVVRAAHDESVDVASRTCRRIVQQSRRLQHRQGPGQNLSSSTLTDRSAGPGPAGGSSTTSALLPFVVD